MDGMMTGDASGQKKKQLRVLVPGEPPTMTAAGAAALLRLIRHVVDRNSTTDAPPIAGEDHAASAAVTEQEAA
jgi:hypothetical protein